MPTRLHVDRETWGRDRYRRMRDQALYGPVQVGPLGLAPHRTSPACASRLWTKANRGLTGVAGTARHIVRSLPEWQCLAHDCQYPVCKRDEDRGAPMGFDRINAHDIDSIRPFWTDATVEYFPDATCRGAEEIAT